MRIKVAIFSLLAIVFASLNAQTGDIISLSVPKNSVSGTGRMPVICKGVVTGLQPNSTYKYVTRGYSGADVTSSTVLTGAGNPLYIRNNGTVKYFAGSVSFSNGATMDTFTTDPGGEYRGWFAIVNTSNARFNAGSSLFLAVTAINITVPDTQRLYFKDTIVPQAFGSGTSDITAIYGESKGTPFQIVSLFDKENPGTDRPLSNALIENTVAPIASVASFYSTNVQGKNGFWGTYIPNNLINGVRNISRYSLTNDIALYSNTEKDGKWGAANINTVNASGGTSAIALGLNEAPLVAPIIKFETTSSSASENKSTHTIKLNRTYYNSKPCQVRIRVVGNTATNGTDYNTFNTQYVVFDSAETSDSITLTITDDAIVESAEEIVLSIDSAKNATLGNPTAHTATIADNDIALLRVVNNAVTVDESAGKAEIKFEITKAVPTTSTVKLSLLSKTSHTNVPAEFKTCFTNNNDTTFTFGKTTVSDMVSVNTLVFEDLVNDLDDTITLKITQLSGSAVLSDSIVRLVILDNDGPSTVGFVGNTANYTETKDSIEVKVAVQKRKGTSSGFAVVNLSNISTATQGSDFVYPTAKILNLTPGSPDTMVFRIALKDDGTYEGSEKLYLGFTNLNKTQFNSNDTFIVNIADNELPLYPIATINKQSAPNYTADSNGIRCAITGTVYGVNTRTAGLGFTIRDYSGGLGVFSPTATSNYMVTEGDSIYMQGRISQFRGIVQMDFLDTIIVLKKNATIKNPTIVNKCSETTESDLVKYKTVKLVSATDWPSAALSANTFKYVRVQHIDGHIDSLNIDAETNIDGTPAPVGYFNVAGLGWQFDNSNPLTGQYYLNPRTLADFEPATLPIIGFTLDSIAHFENAGALDIFLNVNPNSNSFTADVAIKSATALNPGDHTFTTTTITTLVGTSTYKFSVPVVNDNVSDPGKYIIFVLRNLQGPGQIGADSTFLLRLKDDEPASVGKKLSTAGIKIYPVPASNVLNIESPIAISKTEIIDQTGRVVCVQNNAQNIQISQLSKGIYHIVFTTVKGELFTGQFIKE